MNAVPVEPENRELIQRCLAGDGQAWQALVERYARLVHSIPVRYGLTPQEVDDVGQEVFLALAQSLHQLDDPERLPAWLITTTRRVCWRLLQRRRREQPGAAADIMEVPLEASLDSPSSARVPSMSELLAGWSRQELLSQGLERLPPRCRELLTLIFLDPEEPSYEEIAARLGMAVGSIGPTRGRCLRQLRAVLESLGFDGSF
ncbi:RNA polymerase sigma factor [Litorilinea aerophila]|uniref:Sigma-70 family RNA polymerase sigma factor n=1 Tax=Litorilinea aerophila TaxID=1204385 RepID=A0A540VKT3_9CHLR|nr:sigma-70 family RNA polymerase sigma factor [Litorilinea aerophila]